MLMNNKQIYISNILYSFAVGDAMGMVTEFMDRKTISERYGIVSELLSPKDSFIHSDLKKGQVTDDTEQNIYLLGRYLEDNCVTPENTLEALLKWIKETDAIKKGYIGPNSLKALNSVKNGGSIYEAGKSGTTCGSAMRVLAPVLFSYKSEKDILISSVKNCGIPTHNNNLAMESSMAIGFAFYSALKGANMSEITNAFIEGGEIGRRISPNIFVGPSVVQRIKIIKDHINSFCNDEEFMNFIYYVFGTTMEAVDIVTAAMGIFMFAKKDVWKAIRIGASIGGDTDTVAALAGGLSASYYGNNNIPSEIMDYVIKNNNLKIIKEISLKLA